jgi:predicted DNA-binding transcriptional regulator AlpA
MVTADRPLAVSIPQLARITGLSESLLYQRANRGELVGCRRISKRYLVHLATFEEWLKFGNGDDRQEA